MVEAPQAEARQTTCPRCGTPVELGQEYCLDCGLRLAPDGGVTQTLETAWRRRFGSYPGDWIWPVLLALLIAAAGAVAAIALARSNGSERPIVATRGGTAHTPTTPPATATVELPTVPSGTPTATTTAPQPPAQPPPSSAPPPPGALIGWPPSRTGFTVVLESIPLAAGRSFAVARARAAVRAGLPKVGVLDSSRFSSLHPGYFVVFSGVYSTQSEADNARASANGKGFSAAYAREIRP